MKTCQDLYFDLLKRCLTNTIYQDMNLLQKEPFNAKVREHGCDWPAYAHTMVGFKRLDNIRFCIEQVLARGVPGDLLEAGVWRGGATIFMRAVLKVHGVTDRCVWAADSFQGLPPPNPAKYPADAGLRLDTFKELAISLEEVQENFRRYGLLDKQVRFLKGWFRDTLPTAPIQRLAILRLDGDLYESTMDTLVPLYPKLSPGGYLLIDDYFSFPACKQAVHDYRDQHGITEKIIPIDWTGAYWQRA
jgi:hypothetical protein